MGLIDRIRSKLEARKKRQVQEEVSVQQSAVVNRPKPEPELELKPKPKPEKSPVDIFIDNIYEKIDEAKFSRQEGIKEALKAEIKEEFSKLSEEMKKEVKSALWGRWENCDRISRYDDPRCWGASDKANIYMAMFQTIHGDR